MNCNTVCGKDLSMEIRIALGESDFTVTDSNVARLYPDLCEGAFVMPAGEENKNFTTLLSILKGMKNAGLKRNSVVVALGGGVVGDITGMAAALYMRGIDWISIPTTLLAMTDSGIGGKTSVDFDGIKNLVGAFHSAQKTIVSTNFLTTLDSREWLCGTGELIKTCLLDGEAYKLFKSGRDGLNKRDMDKTFELIKECVRIKTAVVEKDPLEKGLRKILNVGHTVGHALESLDGYKLSHGEYVIKGMIAEFEMNKNMIAPEFYAEIMPVLRSLTHGSAYDGKSVCAAAVRDKKNTDGNITMVIVISPGKTAEVKMSRAEFAEKYDGAVKA